MVEITGAASREALEPGRSSSCCSLTHALRADPVSGVLLWGGFTVKQLPVQGILPALRSSVRNPTLTEVLAGLLEAACGVTWPAGSYVP